MTHVAPMVLMNTWFILNWLCAPVSAVAPKVVKTVPADGETNVDPALKQMSITFDQDMDPSGYSICGGGPEFPKIVGKPRWTSKRVLSFSVRLEPDHHYALSVNCPAARSFRGADGTPAEIHPVSFNTGPGEGKTTAATRGDASKRSRSQAGKLQFKLRDAFGREVEAADYLGAPVLILSGACWCGGCQQEAEPFRRLIEEFRPKGVQFIRSIAGENELAAIEFMRHYRLDAVHILDVNREFEKQYNNDGWPFLLLAGADGRVLHTANGTILQETTALRSLMGEATRDLNPISTVVREGVAYMPGTLARSGEADKSHTCDRFSSLACGADGLVRVAFTTNRNGNSDVLARTFDGKKWSSDLPIAATSADEFDPCVVVDARKNVWVSWTSNADGERYNIHVSPLAGGSSPAKPMRVTDADDDAMHARMAIGGDGLLWITYYKWHRMGNRSRDKEVYVRRYDGKAWSDEIRISPSDVPEYEDHSDPAIVAHGRGAAIAWSWDYHQPDGYPKEAETPTVFLRSLDEKLEAGKIQLVSRRGIDIAPTVAADARGRLWSSWDSLAWENQQRANRKGLYVGTPDTEPERLSGPVRNICTPTVITGSDGGLALIWAENRSGGRWTLQRADLPAGASQWSKPKTVEAEGNPRFPDAAYDIAGNLWVTYSQEKDSDRTIIVRMLGDNDR